MKLSLTGGRDQFGHTFLFRLESEGGRVLLRPISTKANVLFLLGPIPLKPHLGHFGESRFQNVDKNKVFRHCFQNLDKNMVVFTEKIEVPRVVGRRVEVLEEWGPSEVGARRMGAQIGGLRGVGEQRSGGSNPENVGGPKCKGPEGWEPEGPKGWEGQNSALFFPFPAPNCTLFCSLWGLLVELWSLFKDMDLSKCAFGPLWGHFVRAKKATLWREEKQRNFGRSGGGGSG